MHTGEVLWVIGQTVAGIASAGAAMLMWTGLALGWRRFGAWRRRLDAPPPVRTTEPLRDEVAA